MQLFMDSTRLGMELTNLSVIYISPPQISVTQININYPLLVNKLSNMEGRDKKYVYLWRFPVHLILIRNTLTDFLSFLI